MSSRILLWAQWWGGEVAMLRKESHKLSIDNRFRGLTTCKISSLHCMWWHWIVHFYSSLEVKEDDVLIGFCLVKDFTVVNNANNSHYKMWKSCSYKWRQGCSHLRHIVLSLLTPVTISISSSLIFWSWRASSNRGDLASFHKQLSSLFMQPFFSIHFISL